MTNEKKKYIIIGIATVIGIIIILFITSRDYTKQNLETYIKAKGYIQSAEGSNIYIKQLSEQNLDEYYDAVKNKKEAEYEINYFDTQTFELKKNKREYLNEVDSNFNQIYDYKTDIINYNYRAVIEDSSFILKGTFKYQNKKETFTCEKEYSSNFKLDGTNIKEKICEKIQYDVSTFYNEMLEIIDNARLLSKLEKRK